MSSMFQSRRSREDRYGDRGRSIETRQTFRFTWVQKLNDRCARLPLVVHNIRVKLSSTVDYLLPEVNGDPSAASSAIIPSDSASETPSPDLIRYSTTRKKKIQIKIKTNKNKNLPGGPNVVSRQDRIEWISRTLDGWTSRATPGAKREDNTTVTEERLGFAVGPGADSVLCSGRRPVRRNGRRPMAKAGSEEPRKTVKKMSEKGRNDARAIGGTKGHGRMTGQGVGIASTGQDENDYYYYSGLPTFISLGK